MALVVCNRCGAYGEPSFCMTSVLDEWNCHVWLCDDCVAELIEEERKAEK